MYTWVRRFEGYEPLSHIRNWVLKRRYPWQHTRPVENCVSHVCGFFGFVPVRCIFIAFNISKMHLAKSFWCGRVLSMSLFDLWFARPPKKTLAHVVLATPHGQATFGQFKMLWSGPGLGYESFSESGNMNESFEYTHTYVYTHAEAACCLLAAPLLLSVYANLTGWQVSFKHSLSHRARDRNIES